MKKKEKKTCTAARLERVWAPLTGGAVKRAGRDAERRDGRLTRFFDKVASADEVGGAGETSDGSFSRWRDRERWEG